jgi:putative ABC transport system permease protein
VLVVGEVALSLVLLVGSGLLIRSFVRLIAVPVGFKPEGLIAMSVSLPTPRYIAPGSMAVFFDRLVSRVESIPGVQSAAVSLALPPNRYLLGPYLAEGQPLVDPGRRPVAQWSSISPGYFRTLGVPLLQGREFTPRDTVLSGRVVIVSQDLARRLWPGADPLGRKLLVARLPDWSEVVGVVGDVKNSGLAHSPEPHMYTPYPQRPWASMQLVVRSAAGDPLRLLGAISASVSSIDPDQPVTDVRTMDAALADSVAETRLVATLLTGFALMALLMAAAGLYGVIAYGVALRTREIGVRVALGAAPRAVLWLVAGDALRLTAAGVVAGTVCAVAASRALRGYLFGVSELDPVTYAAAVTLFGAAAVIAACVPGRRALKVDPLIALRAD